MIYTFSKSSIGYSHIRSFKPCQDFSATYKDSERTIITCADGHGGNIYVRSNRGSRYASNAVLNVFASLTSHFFHNLTNEEIESKLTIELLCEYNRMVESDLSYNHLRKSELFDLSEDEKDKLISNKTKAYGTTLTGAMVLGNKLVLASIGDTECLLVRRGQLIKPFSDDDAPAGNITYSMCQEDAAKYLKIKVLDFRDYDGVFLLTDGLSSPYQSYANFNESFIKPLMNRMLNFRDYPYVENLIEEIASKYGVGDDVSLSFLISDKANIKYYK